jgi:hypothetical protein
MISSQDQSLVRMWTKFKHRGFDEDKGYGPLDLKPFLKVAQQLA